MTCSLLDLVRRQQGVLESEAESLTRLASPEDQCDLAWDRCAIKDDLWSGTAGSKSAAESEAWRNKGNAHFQAGKPELALGCYTEAVLAAPQTSQADPGATAHLALSLANRAAALIKLKYHQEAIQDLLLALEEGYPTQSIFKIHQRLATAWEALGDHGKTIQACRDVLQTLNLANSIAADQKRKAHHEAESRIKAAILKQLTAAGPIAGTSAVCPPPAGTARWLPAGRNKHFPALAECVRVDEDGARGRYSVARQQLDVGTVVARETALAAVLYPDKIRSHCWTCLKRALPCPLPCPACPAIFCSVSCGPSTQQHRYDCWLLSSGLVTDLNPPDVQLAAHLLLAFRIVTSQPVAVFLENYPLWRGGKSQIEANHKRSNHDKCNEHSNHDEEPHICNNDNSNQDASHENTTLEPNHEHINHDTNIESNSHDVDQESNRHEANDNSSNHDAIYGSNDHWNNKESKNREANHKLTNHDATYENRHRETILESRNHCAYQESKHNTANIEITNGDSINVNNHETNEQITTMPASTLHRLQIFFNLVKHFESLDSVVWHVACSVVLNSCLEQSGYSTHLSTCEKKRICHVVCHALAAILPNCHATFQLVPSSLDGVQQVRIGLALYPNVAATFNHSCDPNTFTVDLGTEQITVTARCVDQGEELNQVYHGHFGDTERETRRKELQRLYHFFCQCQACSNDYPMANHLLQEAKTFTATPREKFRLDVEDSTLHALDQENESLREKTDASLARGDVASALEITRERIRMACRYLRSPHILLVMGRVSMVNYTWTLLTTWGARFKIDLPCYY